MIRFIVAAAIFSQLILQAPVSASTPGQTALEPDVLKRTENRYKLEDILVETIGADGQAYYSISFSVLDYYLFMRIAPQTRDYPVTFNSTEQREAIEFELKSIIYLLNLMIENSGPAAEILWRLGYANSLACHLDFPGSYDRADALFERLLQIYPDHPRGNYYYGMFLSGKAVKNKSSIPYLLKSAQMGIDDGLYAVGLIYLTHQNTEEALVYLNRYLKKHPKHEKTRQIIKQIKDQEANHNIAPN
ncbi:tol-pal system YbgF family protein [Thermodesulfobacteriota bacterium]